ncbi:hypothetical protein [Croceicoccus sediminis]|uniref:hypothetical protein n=1 Tax=Croceicoccus sediminis TaxID=2571150 RepID=UPI0011835C44|nr:hypothetical protein [Croceicoccus sediminis]
MPRYQHYTLGWLAWALQAATLVGMIEGGFEPPFPAAVAGAVFIALNVLSLSAYIRWLYAHDESDFRDSLPAFGALMFAVVGLLFGVKSISAIRLPYVFGRHIFRSLG